MITRVQARGTRRSKCTALAGVSAFAGGRIRVGPVGSPRCRFGRRTSLQKSAAVVGALGLLVPISCTSQARVVTDPCAVLSRDDVASAVGAHVDRGRRVAAIGESVRRVCSFGTNAPVRTVTVYLAYSFPRTVAPRTGPVSAVYFDVGNRRGYIVVGVQFANAKSKAVTYRLAHVARRRLMAAD